MRLLLERMMMHLRQVRKQRPRQLCTTTGGWSAILLKNARTRNLAKFCAVALPITDVRDRFVTRSKRSIFLLVTQNRRVGSSSTESGHFGHSPDQSRTTVSAYWTSHTARKTRRRIFLFVRWNTLAFMPYAGVSQYHRTDDTAGAL